MSRIWTRRLGHAIRVVPGVWLGVTFLCLATLPGRGRSAEELIACRQMDRMAASLQWLKERGVSVVYAPFVKSDDRYKRLPKQGSENIVQLYRLVHDYFTYSLRVRQPAIIIWD